MKQELLNNLFSSLENNRGGIIYYQGNRRRESLYSSIYKDVDKAVKVLLDHNLNRGDYIIINGENSYEWVVFDLACLFLGAISVPLRDVNEQILSEIRTHRHVDTIISNVNYSSLNLNCIQFDEFYREKEVSNLSPVKYRENDIFTVIYTSGTTSHPKFIEVRRKSFDILCRNGIDEYKINEHDILVAFLPFTVYLQRVYIYGAILLGANVIVTNIMHLLPVMKKENPTVLIAIPYLFELMRNSILTKIYSDKRKVIYYKILTWINKFYPYKKNKILNEVFGTRIRFAASGSAALNINTYNFFKGIGLTIYQAYGMNEIGIIAMNGLNKNFPGSVGIPCKGFEVNLADDGEIIVKSPYMTNAEYLSGKHDTYKMDDVIYTNDLGYFNKEGFLFLTGRKSSTIILKNGQKYFPEEEENNLETIPGVLQSLCIASNNEYIVYYISITQGASEEKIKEEISNYYKIGKLLSKPLKINFLKEPFSIQNNLLTPSLKKNRQLQNNQ